MQKISIYQQPICFNYNELLLLRSYGFSINFNGYVGYLIVLRKNDHIFEKSITKYRNFYLVKDCFNETSKCLELRFEILESSIRFLIKSEGYS